MLLQCGIPSGRLPRYARNDTKCVARGKIKSVSQSRHFLQANKTFSFPYEVLCHCEALPTAMPWQSPGRAPYHKTRARYFCTCVEKKAHTSKRVSIAAPTMRFQKRNVRRCHIDTHHCQLLRLAKKMIFKKIFKKFELNKTKNGGFPKSDFPFRPENTSVLTKRRRFCIIKL